MTDITGKVQNLPLSSFYLCTDLVLASVLSLHFHLEGIDRQHVQRVFFFKRSPQLDALVASYFQKQLTIEPQLFYTKLKQLKRELYLQQPPRDKGFESVGTILKRHNPLERSQEK